MSDRDLPSDNPFRRPAPKPSPSPTSTTATNINPTSDSSTFAFSRPFEEELDGDRHLQTYRSRVALDPTLVEKYFKRGQVYERKTQYLKAMVQYTKVIEIQTSFPNVYTRRAMMYLALKNYRFAVSDLTKAIESVQRENYVPAELYFHRGRAYAFLGLSGSGGRREREAAICDLQKGVAFEVDSGPGGMPRLRKRWAWALLAGIFRRMRRFEDCEKFGSKAMYALVDRPESPDRIGIEGMYFVGIAMEKTGRFEEARKTFQSAKAAYERLLGIEADDDFDPSTRPLSLSFSRRVSSQPRKQQHRLTVTTTPKPELLLLYEGMIPESELARVLRRSIKRARRRFERDQAQMFREEARRHRAEVHASQGTSDPMGRPSIIDAVLPEELVEAPEPGPEDEEEGEDEEDDEDERVRTERYLGILEEAKQMDFSDLDRMRIVSILGKDSLGRTIVVFKEMPFTVDQVHLLLPYLLSQTHQVVDGQYVLVWCMNNQKPPRRKGTMRRPKQAKPGLTFLLQAYRSLAHKVRKNLKAVFVVHPNFYVKLIFKFFRRMVGPKFWAKTHLVADLYHNDLLQSVVNVHRLPLPETVIRNNIRLRKMRPPTHPAYFGVPLTEVMYRPENANYPCPRFIHLLMVKINAHINREGLFRTVGDKEVVESHRLAIDLGYSIDFRHSSIIVATSVMKLWFRMMPDPLFTSDLFEQFMECWPDPEVADVMPLIEQLPPAHKSTATVLFHFLYRIAENREVNKMGPANLAICFGPNVMKSTKLTKIQLLGMQGGVSGMVQFMLENTPAIFGPVPSAEAPLQTLPDAPAPELLGRTLGKFPILKNFFVKKGGGTKVVSRSHRRWFVMDDTTIVYYERGDEQSEKGRFNLGDIVDVVVSGNELRLVTPTRTFSLRHDDVGLVADWAVAVRARLPEGQLRPRRETRRTTRRTHRVATPDTSPPPQHTGKYPVLKDFFVKKGGGGRIVSTMRSHRRWFVLDDVSLTYYERDDEQSEKGKFYLRDVRKVQVVKNELLLHRPHRTFSMRNDSFDVVHGWAAAVRARLAGTAAPPPPRPSVPKKRSHTERPVRRPGGAPGAPAVTPAAESHPRHIAVYYAVKKEFFVKKGGGTSLFSASHKRWFVLDDECLKYYEHQDEVKERGRFYLREISEVKIRQNELLLVTPTRTYSMRNDDEAIVQDWAKAVSQRIPKPQEG